MKRPSVRFTVRRLMIAVVVAALSLAVWVSRFDPVRRWQRAVTDDENGLLRWEALAKLDRVDTATALATLTDALRSPSPRIRETALSGLGRLGPKARPAAASFLGALADPKSQIRTTAAQVLRSVFLPGDPGREEALPALARMLGDHSPHVRLAAASALAEFEHGSEALPVLIEALRRPDYMAQCDALRALVRLGPRIARDALPEVVALPSRADACVGPGVVKYLRAYAAEARCLLGDRDGGLAALRTLADGLDPDLADETRRVLSRLPDEVR